MLCQLARQWFKGLRHFRTVLLRYLSYRARHAPPLGRGCSRLSTRIRSAGTRAKGLLSEMTRYWLEELCHVGTVLLCYLNHRARYAPPLRRCGRLRARVRGAGSRIEDMPREIRCQGPEGLDSFRSVLLCYFERVAGQTSTLFVVRTRSPEELLGNKLKPVFCDPLQ